jgi:hypothetical protein
MTMVRWGTSIGLAREFAGGGEIEMSRDASGVAANPGRRRAFSLMPPHTFPIAGIPNESVGPTPWSARDALVPLVREESVGRDHRGADQGVGRGRGRPPHSRCHCPETGKACGIRLSARLQASLPATRGSLSTTSGFAVAPKEGRDESRPGRQEYLGHDRGRAQDSTQSVTEGRHKSNPKVRQ